jgi:hypothetical protein
MPYRSVLLALTAAGVIALAGCGSSDVTMYEAGVYKGKPDPLVEEQASPEQQERLRERALTAMTDR